MADLPSGTLPQAPSPLARPRRGFVATLRQVLAALGTLAFGAEPRFWPAFLRFGALSAVLFSRLPTTNYIFDEQEALLANPYVNATSGLRFVDAIHRDFWGLPPERSVGSYRPIPDFLWRLTWPISKAPFFHHFYNVLFHAANGAILAAVVYALTRRRALSWLSGVTFVACAVLTEAVSGIVGIADVLGGMGAMLALAALLLPGWGMPLGVFSAVLFGLFCKESALVCVPLVPFAALLLAPLTHPERPRRAIRALLALSASVGAFVLYVELRKAWFPSPLAIELMGDLPPTASRLEELSRAFLVWFHQAPLPKDPLNNPLADAPTPLRIAGALRVYWRGLTQVVLPKTLSGDYSFPQEPVPDNLHGPETVLGAAMTALPLAASVVLWLVALVRERRARRDASALAGAPAPASLGRRIALGAGSFLAGIAASGAAVDLLVFRPRGETASVLGHPWWWLAAPLAVLAIGLLVESGAPLPRPDERRAPVPLRRVGVVFLALGLTWIVVSYFPHSNVPVALPTVRAERFWYFPAIGSSLVLAALFAGALERATSRRAHAVVTGLIAAFLGFQSVQAYRHAMDYRDDLAFWGATKDAVPNSAKAHLNYSVMKGARNDLDTRLDESKRALELAPSWPMAHIYTGDTLCRMHRVSEAWPYYKKGFELGPNELGLIALALQCIYDEGKLTDYDAELRALVDTQAGSWIAYLASDTLENGVKNEGVDPKYRPRGYNEGPKSSE